jgi:hypothetical protein
LANFHEIAQIGTYYRNKLRQAAFSTSFATIFLATSFTLYFFLSELTNYLEKEQARPQGNIPYRDENIVNIVLYHENFCKQMDGAYEVGNCYQILNTTFKTEWIYLAFVITCAYTTVSTILGIRQLNELYRTLNKSYFYIRRTFNPSFNPSIAAPDQYLSLPVTTIIPAEESQSYHVITKGDNQLFYVNYLTLLTAANFVSAIIALIHAVPYLDSTALARNICIDPYLAGDEAKTALTSCQDDLTYNVANSTDEGINNFCSHLCSREGQDFPVYSISIFLAIGSALIGCALLVLRDPIYQNSVEPRRPAFLLFSQHAHIEDIVKVENALLKR